MEQKNTELAQKLAHTLSDIVTLRFILQGYHWNVMGPDFGEYHEFFRTLYEDVESSVDPMAENILKVGFPAPYLITDYAEISCLKEPRLDGSSSKLLLESAQRVNETVTSCLMGCFKAAEACDEQGLMDFLAQRIDMHKKWNWQIRAFLGVR